MSSLNLHELASRRPSEKATLDRLEQAFQSGHVYSLDRLLEVIQPTSEQKFIILLGELVASGALHVIYRVEAPGSGQGLKDFSRTEEIPNRIEDWSSGREIPVTSDNIRVLYEAVEAHGA